MTTQMTETDDIETGDELTLTLRGTEGGEMEIGVTVEATKRDRAVVHYVKDGERLGDLSAIPPVSCDDDAVVSSLSTYHRRKKMADSYDVTGVEITSRNEE